MTDWHRYLDLYCERTAPGFWAEPVNALSNASFLVAAAVLAWQWRRRAAPLPLHLWLLAGLMACIGLGSFVFHTQATVFTAYFDSGFIALYLLAFVCVWLHRVRAVPWPRALWGAPAFAAFIGVVTAGLLQLQIAWLSSDVTLYASAWLALLVLILASRGPAPATARGLMLTLAVFSLSLTMRQIDLPLCARWPQGTHFLWHLLNGLALYCSARAVQAAPRPPGTPHRMR